ncbi:hypothetical protein VNO77_24632 [Canavalia gladiata]|uniref:Uncharacterized protein n=1 Tax=Canavalia gladiata TaxID=3824 RepID=A0AAN9QGH0_CANGL
MKAEVVLLELPLLEENAVVVEEEEEEVVVIVVEFSSQEPLVKFVVVMEVEVDAEAIVVGLDLVLILSKAEKMFAILMQLDSHDKSNLDQEIHIAMELQPPEA